MAWMVVSKGANMSRGKFSFNAKPSAIPQRWPRAFVDFCVVKGCAQEVKPPDKATAKLLLDNALLSRR